MITPENRAMARSVLIDIINEQAPAAPPADDVPPIDTIPPNADAELEHAPEMAQPEPLMLVCPPAWRGKPLKPRRWLATNRITAADAIILSGDGGGGKTTIALQLAVAVAQGLGEWLGTTCQAGPVILFSAEEPEDEMRLKLHSAARARHLEADGIENLYFHFAEPDDCLLGIGRPNGPVIRTPLFDALRVAVFKIRPALIVVDSIAATFGGNQNDRVHARTFVGLFRKLAREGDCAILLLDHPSLSGITNGTGRGGSVDWQNATRGRMYLETVTDDDGAERVLTVKKTNYAKEGERIKLRWEEGCFVPQGTAPPPYRAAAERQVDDLFLRLLEQRNTQGRWVTPNKAIGYAPKELATMPDANGTTAAALAKAMERLLAAQRVTVETFGPPSRQRQRLIPTPSDRLPTGE
jgi:RecA-family ATPase